MGDEKAAMTVFCKIVEELDLTALSIANTAQCTAIITAALHQVARETWEEAADEFENNYDGGDERYGKPKYLAYCRKRAKENTP